MADTFISYCFKQSTEFQMQHFMHRAHTSLILPAWKKEYYSYFNANIFISLYYSMFLCVCACGRERSLLGINMHIWCHLHFQGRCLQNDRFQLHRHADHFSFPRDLRHKRTHRFHTSVSCEYFYDKPHMVLIRLIMFFRFKLLFYLWHMTLFFMNWPQESIFGQIHTDKPIQV